MSSFAMANGSAREVRNDFRQSPGGPEAEYLDIGDIAFRTELLLEGIFNKNGDWWYTSPNGLNNNYRYDSKNKEQKKEFIRILFLIRFSPNYHVFGFFSTANACITNVLLIFWDTAGSKSSCFGFYRFFTMGISTPHCFYKTRLCI